MPFKSKAQRRKFAELLVKGDITPETYEEWNRDTGRQELPERVHRAKSKSRKTAGKKSTKKAKKKGKKKATRNTAKRKAKKR